MGAVALALLMCVAAPQARAQAPAAPEAAAGHTGIDPQRLDRTISEVIRRREFAWRTPRPAGPEPQGRWVGWVRSALDTVAKGVAWVMEQIRNWFRRKPDENSGKKPATERPPIEIWIALVAIALLAAGVAAFIAGRRRKAIVAQPVKLAAAPIDLADESVTADQMPESSWLQLAEELLAKGDCRLALRALVSRRFELLERDGSGFDSTMEIGARLSPRTGAPLARARLGGRESDTGVCSQRFPVRARLVRRDIRRTRGRRSVCAGLGGDQALCRPHVTEPCG